MGTSFSVFKFRFRFRFCFRFCFRFLLNLGGDLVEVYICAVIPLALFDVPVYTTGNRC